jgi:hypothetical protein
MLNYALNNACYIAEIPAGKEVDLPNINLKDTKTTHVLRTSD